MLGRRSPFITMVAGVILVDQIEEVDNKARVPVNVAPVLGIAPNSR